MKQSNGLATVNVLYFDGEWHRWGLIIVERNDIDSQVIDALQSAGIHHTEYTWTRYTPNVYN